MSHHGELLKKIVRRKKLTQDQAAGLLGFSRDKLNRLFNKETIDEITREEIEKTFEVPSTYFVPAVQKAPLLAPPPQTVPDPGCWQQLAEARQEIIDLQKQVLAMTRPSINAPRGRKEIA